MRTPGGPGMLIGTTGMVFRRLGGHRIFSSFDIFKQTQSSSTSHSAARHLILKKIERFTHLRYLNEPEFHLPLLHKLFHLANGPRQAYREKAAHYLPFFMKNQLGKTLDSPEYVIKASPLLSNQGHKNSLGFMKKRTRPFCASSFSRNDQLKKTLAPSIRGLHPRTTLILGKCAREHLHYSTLSCEMEEEWIGASCFHAGSRISGDQPPPKAL
jgi:hypothetical protein